MAKKKAAEVIAKLKAVDVSNDVEKDERVKLLQQDINTLQRKLIKAKAATDIIVQGVYDVLAGKKFLVTVPPKPSADRRKKHVEMPVLCIGDTHFGHYHPHGEFAYSVAIGKRRLHQAVNKFIETTNDRRTSAKIDEMRLYLIGDIIEGENMRQGHAHSIEGPLLKQAIFWGPEALSSMIIKLLGEFRKIKIVAVPGNHGRNGPARGDAHPATNWDRVCYQTTRHIVNNVLMGQDASRIKDIEWDLPTDRYDKQEGDDWFSVDYIFDWSNLLVHGEDIRGKGWGGIPFYGVEKMIKRYADILDDPIDFMYMGHIHVDANIPSNFREIFVNGAIESSTTYVRKQLIAGNHPSQSAVFYTKDNGPISRHTFYLDGGRTPQGQRTVRALKRRDARRAAKKK
mgnify:FL=1|jgi:hypothetical protein|tara:strand:+ start:1157 stop:2350 length:1194 start_codon:yes stop_codon:yes gene_type:complete